MSENQNATLLFVDDEENILNVVEEYFQRKGYAVFTAGNGYVALEILDRESIDCCLTDINMPGMNGLELAEKIRMMDNTIPVVIITGHPSLDNALITLKNGVVDFLVKPIRLDQIDFCVRRVMRERKLLEENLLLKNEIKGKERLEKLNTELILKNKELGILNRIMEDFNGIHSVSEIFSYAVKLGCEITTADEMSFYVIDEALQKLTEVSFYSRPGNRRVLTQNVKKSFTSQAAVERFIMKALPDGIPLLAARNTRPSGSNGLPDSILSFMMVPLKIRENIFGVLSAVGKTENCRFKEKDLYYLSFMGKKAAHAIENLALYENIYENLFSTLSAFVTAVEARDAYTHQHSNRVTEVAMLIGSSMKRSQEELDVLNVAGRLHDIGKIGIRDEILLKPGRLTDEEFEKIKAHPVIGANIVGQLGLWDREQQIIRYHHERFDGSGYPDGLKGEDIPVLSRILSVADAYDAMASDRAYRKKMQPDVILANIRNGSGTQFDPRVVDTFLRLHDEGRITPA